MKRILLAVGLTGAVTRPMVRTAGGVAGRGMDNHHGGMLSSFSRLSRLSRLYLYLSISICLSFVLFHYHPTIAKNVLRKKKKKKKGWDG